MLSILVDLEAVLLRLDSRLLRLILAPNLGDESFGLLGLGVAFGLPFTDPPFVFGKFNDKFKFFLTCRSSISCPRDNDEPRRTEKSSVSPGMYVSSAFAGSMSSGICNAPWFPVSTFISGTVAKVEVLTNIFFSYKVI